MDDGKPMLVSIIEQDGKLALEFIKTGEGLLANISGIICKAGTELEARFSKEEILLGPAANLMLRLVIADGGVFTFSYRTPNELKINLQGWNGRFVPATVK